MRKTLEVELDVPDDRVVRCKLDFPGGVYQDGPRLSFYDASGTLLLCRSPDARELVLFEDVLTVREVILI